MKLIAHHHGRGKSDPRYTAWDRVAYQDGNDLWLFDWIRDDPIVGLEVYYCPDATWEIEQNGWISVTRTPNGKGCYRLSADLVDLVLTHPENLVALVLL